jgi:1,4-dihydroxy-2-naphthoyl-CoA hydrolase
VIDWHDAMPLTRVLGIERVSESPEEVQARLEWREELCTAGGVLHGGALMALADCAAAICAFPQPAQRRRRDGHDPIEHHVPAPVRDGHVEAVARPLRVGASVIAVETEIVDANGRAVPHVVQSKAVLRG